MIRIDAVPCEDVEKFADRLLLAARNFGTVVGVHNSREMVAHNDSTRAYLLAQWDSQAPSDQPKVSTPMTDKLTDQIAALRTAIMRRVEYDGSIHASSLEEEIGRWVREVMAPEKAKDAPRRVVERSPYLGGGHHAFLQKRLSEYDTLPTTSQIPPSAPLAETRLVDGKKTTYVNLSTWLALPTDRLVKRASDHHGAYAIDNYGTYYRIKE